MKPIDKTALFQFLSTQPPSVLLDILMNAYDEMDRNRRQVVFGQYIPKLPPVEVDGDVLWDEVKEFQRESLAGRYYEPFEINSKNWTHIPDETQEWFDRLGELLTDSAQLTRQGGHAQAIACFGMLFELIDKMESGEEIVFGDEIGGWMIPGDEKQFIAAYLESLAVVATPEAFTAAVAPLLKRDSWQSFSGQVHATAVRVANQAQKAHLEAEIVQQKIKIQR